MQIRSCCYWLGFQLDEFLDLTQCVTEMHQGVSSTEEACSWGKSRPILMVLSSNPICARLKRR